MTIRTDFSDFPFDCRTKVVWYFLVSCENSFLVEEYCNVSEKSNLVQKLEEISSSGLSNKYKLFGVWPGQWSTDVFDIPINIAYEKLEKHF